MKNCFVPAIVLALLVSACSSNSKKPDPSPESQFPQERPRGLSRDTDPLTERRRQRDLAKLDAQQFYLRARTILDRSDFPAAIEAYDELTERYPFSDYATQGELERIYAMYRNFQPDRALSSADRFLREHPRHGAIDYIYYLKGLINFEREGTSINILPIDETKSDVSSQRRSFDDFSILIQRFPDSRFAGDAYQRMVYVRNRAAAHELHVVDYYVRRGAYVAAAKRAEQIVAQYPGTLAGYKALAILAECYDKGGLTQQAEDSRKLLAAQDQAVVRRALATPISKLGDKEAAAEREAAEAGDDEGGFFARIASFFDPADTSEEGIEFVIPTGQSAEAPEALETAPAGSPETSSLAEQAEAAAQASNSTPSAEPAEDAANLRRIELFFEPYDAEQEQDEDSSEESN